MGASCMDHKAISRTNATKLLCTYMYICSDSRWSLLHVPSVPSHSLCSVRVSCFPQSMISTKYLCAVIQSGTSSIPFHVSASHLQVYPMLRSSVSTFSYSGLASSSCFVFLRLVSIAVTVAQLLHFLPIYYKALTFSLSFCIYFPFMSTQSAPSFPFLQPSLSFGFAILQEQNGQSFAC